jgi:hypothetical protein
MAQQVEHDWSAYITKRKNDAGETVYAIKVDGGCSDLASSIQSEQRHKDLPITSIAFSGPMTLVQLRDAVEAALVTAARG